ncbi:hypothetical protein HRG84_19110 [Flavisolibacter sp. BT320]|nr:hypothetical protein [Flavisolibacter longurius]
MPSFIKKGNTILDFQFGESLYAWLEDCRYTINEHFLFSVPVNDFKKLLYIFHSHIHFWFSQEEGNLRDQIVQRLNSKGFYDDFYPLVDRVQTPGLYDILEEIKGSIQLYDEKVLTLILEDKTMLSVDLIEDDMHIKEWIDEYYSNDEMKVGDQFLLKEYYVWYFMDQQRKGKVVEEYKGYIEFLNLIYSETGYDKRIILQ